MNKHPSCQSKWLVTLAVAAGFFGSVVAQDLESVLGAGASKTRLAQASQQRIDEVVEQTRNLDAEYRQVMKEADGLEVYNEFTQRQIDNQLLELEALNRSIDQVSVIERQIMPLMIRMLASLRRFIELDMPFFREERLERVADLEALMERADISAAEKFRRLTEAFQIENDFGRTIEAYNDTVIIEDATLEVSVLRIGRIGLYFQTGDASATRMWDQAAQDWIPLTSSQARDQVRQGLRIANKQVAPDLLLLPIGTPEVAP